ncbi:UDP-3-O-(3-hydroxymyristoyl)glucosamine N-acyltransferase [Desulfococcaceae bacterium HSG8]|nr:UDP-3-O-(3-hydroxymyristoyl)glucosamine N-acyltransferase [Desulfococcaceae bacterium HSG8]
MKKYTVEEISQHVKGTLMGNPSVLITGIEQIDRAIENQLTFIGSKKYVKLWNTSDASAAIVNEGLDVELTGNKALICVADADLALADILRLFEPDAPKCEPGIHQAAVIDPTADIREGVSVGAGSYIGAGAVIGPHVRLYPNVTVMDDSHIGEGTTIWPGTVIRERCRIGNNCIIHPNVTIGADGFGFRVSSDGKSRVKIPQIGTVTVGDDVEIGANTCIDRGKFSATVIGNGTKIDNLVQIAHNCRIGRSCTISGMAGLSGSVTVEDGVTIGGGVGVRDHVTIGRGAILGGRSGVTGDIGPGQIVFGFPADDRKKVLRQWAAIKKLPDLIKNLRKTGL